MNSMENGPPAIDSSGSGGVGGGELMTIDMEQEPLTESECTDKIIVELTETGIIHFLRRHISDLLKRHGWNARLKHLVIEYIRQHGPNNVGITLMWSDLAAMALEMTPDPVREEVMENLNQFGRTIIEVNEDIPFIPEPEWNDEKKYEMQSRDAVPEPPSGLYPPKSPPNPVLDGRGQRPMRYVKPPWLFVYDKPSKPRTGVVNGATTTEVAAPGDEASKNSDQSEFDDASSYASSYSNATTSEHMLNDDEDENTPTSPRSLDSSRWAEASTSSRNKNFIAGRPHHHHHHRSSSSDNKEQKKRLLEKISRQGQEKQRLLKTTAEESRRPKTSAGASKISGLESPQLSIPLRQLKLDKKSQDAVVAANVSSKHSSSSSQSHSQQQPSAHHHHPKSKGDIRKANNDLVEDEEEEELMDV